MKKMNEQITSIPHLPPRTIDGHKGLYGKVLIVGGSRGMIGAPALAANAAFRSGAGLVRVASPVSIQLNVAQLSPCATSIPLPQDDAGLISASAIHDILNALEENDSLALGPGLGRGNDLKAILEKIVAVCDKPMVIDADALNNLSALAGGELRFTDKTILTPHPGEMKRLWTMFFRKKLPANRNEQAQKLAQKCSAVVVLKGANTIVTDGASTYINKTGNPGMATGGSGDVLTGCIAALLANKEASLSTLSAAVLGVYIHGRAGDLAVKRYTETSLMADDLVEFLPDAWASHQK